VAVPSASLLPSRRSALPTYANHFPIAVILRLATIVEAVARPGAWLRIVGRGSALAVDADEVAGAVVEGLAGVTLAVMLPLAGESASGESEEKIARKRHSGIERVKVDAECLQGKEYEYETG
jgi:hypothetical protein